MSLISNPASGNITSAALLSSDWDQLRLTPNDDRMTAAPLNSARQSPVFATSGSDLYRLRSLIAVAEAGRMGYNAVQHGAKRRPPKLPTAMTVAEILAWIKATPNQPHAIGRYQFIPATLKDLVRRTGISKNTRFSPDLQDRLANVLLMDAGLLEFQLGQIERKKFMNNLARIWAGLPTSTGKSAYDGYAGNRATISWATYDREMASIFR